ncbi:heme o synthase [Tautonia sociabilis]|uniref:Protoheme IX farnesyltransferase n=1 Tax=Tautonia sociabilis TaxID=2080755 RepID=A0A432MIK2_9BACT|nr:heme o synthase [Tautonia sociabilis]RUL87191.1 protoheme IX farnesyltransferase [Tautonia sociabilis]
MNTTAPPLTAAEAQALSVPVDRLEGAGGRAGWLEDYVALTKPKIVALVLVTVSVGYLLGARGSANPLYLAAALLGTGLVAASGSVWNQVLECSRDARMRRTARRPLPSGRVAVWKAAIYGSALGVAGLALLLAGPHPVAAAVAALTFVLYAFVYTWLKPVTTLNTAVGAVPGALPPVIGWAAATGGLGIEAWALFLIVFLWQFPHFLAIAWIHREDYARGGHRMLPSVDPLGVLTGRQAAGHALVLVPVGLLPVAIGLAGPVYFLGALGLGLYYLAGALRFWHDVSDATARRLLGASFLYLPAVLLLLLLNPLPA